MSRPITGLPGKSKISRPPVFSGEVVVHVGELRVFDLDAGDVAPREVVAHDRVLALADIDARVRRVVGRRVLDQHVRDLDRVQAIRAVGRVLGVAPRCTHALDGHTVGVLDPQAVFLGVDDRQITDREVITDHVEAVGLRRLGGEVEDRALVEAALDTHALTTDGDAVGANRDLVVELEHAEPEHQRGAILERVGGDLQAFLVVRGDLMAVGARKVGARAQREVGVGLTVAVPVAITVAITVTVALITVAVAGLGLVGVRASSVV
jgi:hypothetical protein